MFVGVSNHIIKAQTLNLMQLKSLKGMKPLKLMNFWVIGNC